MDDLTPITEVNRFEVIDWTKSAKMGRSFTKWIEAKFKVTYQLQDQGRTLKIFLVEKETPDETATT